MEAIALLGQHVRLTGRLFWRYGLLLTAIWAAGMLLDQLLLRLAVQLGLQNRLLGLVAIAPVILLQLVIFVSFFTILRNGLPRMRLRRWKTAAADTSPPSEDEAGQTPFAMALLAVLVPFYGYYAGWGLLGDTLRSYSQVFLDAQTARIDFSNPQPMRSAFEIGQTAWVVLAVALIWAVRRFAKSRNARSDHEYWAILIVACEATWALLGLYVLSDWKNEFAAWLAALPSPAEVIDWIVPAAQAAVGDAARPPVDWPTAPTVSGFLTSLFWYALLPVVWFNLGAIVYGHDMHSLRDETQHLAGRAIRGWQALPKPVADFIGHFWVGMIKRWHAVTNGIFLAASAGFALTASIIVLWRLVDWLGNWSWVGLAHLIGPQDRLSWQVLSVPLNALFNAPGAPAGGLLVSPLQFCILAAGLELAGRAQDRAASARLAADARPV